SPPRISEPTCMPALPSTVRRPADIPAPIHLTRLQSPSTTTCRSAESPATAKNSPKGSCRLPWCTGRRAISSTLLPASWSGTTHPASTGTVVEARYLSRSIACPLRRQQLVQVQMERPQLAAVVAGGDAEHAGAARRPQANPRRLLDRGQIQ